MHARAWTLVAVLCVSGAAVAAGTWMPSAALLEMLPADPVDGEPVAPRAMTTAEVAEAFRDHERHAKDLVVTRVEGDAAATRGIILVPQFHRSPDLPLLWSSLGEAVSGVQENVMLITAFSTTRLGVRCVGTEGHWADRITRADELETLARAAGELSAMSAEVGRLMGTSETAVHEATRDVVQLLRPYLVRQLLTLDGVGAALARRNTLGVTRFGLEDRALNAKALGLLKKLRPLEEELARLAPETQGAVEDEFGRIWREEYPAFRSTVADPLSAALGLVDAARKRALAERVELDAEALGRFSRLARAITDELLRPDDVAAYAEHYAEVSRAPDVPVPPARVPDAKTRKRMQLLELRALKIRAQYEDISGRAREQVAVKRAVSRLPAAGMGFCVVVMGANHADGLVEQVLAQGKGKLGVVVVQPWPEDAGGE